MAWVRLPDSTLYLDWVFCFSTLQQEVFLRVLRSSPLLKNQNLLCLQLVFQSWKIRHLNKVPFPFRLLCNNCFQLSHWQTAMIFRYENPSTSAIAMCEFHILYIILPPLKGIQDEVSIAQLSCGKRIHEVDRAELKNTALNSTSTIWEIKLNLLLTMVDAHIKTSTKGNRSHWKVLQLLLFESIGNENHRSYSRSKSTTFSVVLWAFVHRERSS